MTEDLVAWLRAQLDEDERDAPNIHDQHTDAYMISGCNCDWPDRMRREVEAKRRILDLHPYRRFAEPLAADSPFEEDHRAAFPGTPEPYVGCETCNWDPSFEVHRPGWWCETVRLLALPLADRPGYRQEWAP